MEKYLKEIEAEIGANNVVLYMKGSKDFPLCGFSANVCQILQNLNVEFKDVDILQDENLRSAIKEFSKWPTIPQLYIKGEFIGGCDIVRELHATGELKKLLDL
jgi:monothiol glutaredoxin